MSIVDCIGNIGMFSECVCFCLISFVTWWFGFSYFDCIKPNSILFVFATNLVANRENSIQTCKWILHRYSIDKFGIQKFRCLAEIILDFFSQFKTQSQWLRVRLYERFRSILFHLYSHPSIFWRKSLNLCMWMCPFVSVLARNDWEQEKLNIFSPPHLFVWLSQWWLLWQP